VLTKEQFNNERDYLAMIAMVGNMLALGAIDEQDYQLLQLRLLEQYQPVVSCLRADQE
jgi:hypothetical protein